MQRAFRQVRPLDRGGVPKRLPRPEIVVVCEGKVTEPKYFLSFSAIYGNSLVTVTPVGGCGVPISVVQRAIEEKSKRIVQARRSRDSFEVSEIWAVFDRDQHPGLQVPQALMLAAENDIRIAFSNPCFEVWGLMHFSCYGRPGHHHEVQAALKKVLAGYCHETNPRIDPLDLSESYETAVQNSARACEERCKEGRPSGDPSTSVHLLTERIRGLGRK